MLACRQDFDAELPRLCASGHGRGVAGAAVAVWYAKTDFASLISN
jgi:hypothetical protein